MLTLRVMRVSVLRFEMFLSFVQGSDGGILWVSRLCWSKQVAKSLGCQYIQTLNVSALIDDKA